MIAIITGDIINSRKIVNQEIWINPLKKILSEYGSTPKDWEIFRGDYFQIEIKNPQETLKVALRIKACIKSIDNSEGKKRTSPLDIRMAIGLGIKEYDADKISESNGTAFINSGEKFEKLKKEKTTMAIQSPFPKLDKEINLYLKLALIQMDNWSINSGELMGIVLENPLKNQSEIAEMIGIEQNSTSDRYKRANAEEIMELEKMYRLKIKEVTI